MIADLIYLFLVSFLLFAELKHLKDFNDCKSPVGFYILSIPGSLLPIAISNIFITGKICINYWVFIQILFVTAFVLVMLAGLPILAISLIYTPQCGKGNMLLVHGIISVIFNIIIYTVIFAMVYLIYKEFQSFRKEKKLKKQVQKIYQKIHSKNFKVEEFIEKNKEYLEKDLLTNKEKAILEDSFVIECNVDQMDLKKQNRVNCIICLSEFEKGEKALCHPICQHTYHIKCFKTWLDLKNTCPTCKQVTRTCMLRSLVRSKEENLVERNRFLRASQICNTELIGFNDGEY